MIRIRRLRYTAEPLRVEEAIRDPYRVKVLRKVSDLKDLKKFYDFCLVFIYFLLGNYFYKSYIKEENIRLRVVFIQSRSFFDTVI